MRRSLSCRVWLAGVSLKGIVHFLYTRSWLALLNGDWRDDASKMGNLYTGIRTLLTIFAFSMAKELWDLGFLVQLFFWVMPRILKKLCALGCIWTVALLCL